MAHKDLVSYPLICNCHFERGVVSLFQRCAPSVANIQTSVLKRDVRLNAVEVPSFHHQTARCDPTDCPPPPSPARSSSARAQVPSGSGSGFVWDELGHVVTNYHVIKDARIAKVSLPGTGGNGLVAYEVGTQRARGGARRRGRPPEREEGLARRAVCSSSSCSPLLLLARDAVPPWPHPSPNSPRRRRATTVDGRRPTVE